MDHNQSILQAFLSLFFLILISVFLPGCSGGGGGVDEAASTPVTETYIGQVLLGPIVDGTVSLYKYSNPGIVLWEGHTSNSNTLADAGLIEFPETLIRIIDDNALYFIEVDGGKDIDADDDDVLDTAPTPVLGKLHMIAPGRYFKVSGEAGNPGFIVSCLSEMVFQKAFFDGVGTAAESVIVSRIGNVIPELLGQDITGDGAINTGDVAVWDPVADQGSLNFSDTLLTGIIEKIHSGEDIVATITATAGEGGAISPSGVTTFFCGTDMSYHLDVADRNSSCIREVFVDGVPVDWNGSCGYGSYTFESISAPHTIHVTSKDYSFGRTHLGQFSSPEDIYVSGDYAYVADGAGGLKILNVSDPAQPLLMGGTETPGTAQGVVVTGNYAYMADGEGGLQIVDINDREHPECLAGIASPDDDAIGVQVSDGYAYVVADHYVLKSYGKSCGEGVLHVIDVRTPETPVLTGSVSLEGSSCQLKDICVSKGVAYVVSDSGGLYLIDIADPANPTVISHPSIQTPGQIASSVTVNGGYAYLVTSALIPTNKGGGKRLLYTIDIRDPATPMITGSVALGEYPVDISVRGEYAYVTGCEPAFQKIDISDPASPFIAGTLLPSGCAGDFYIADGYAYATQRTEIVIIDMDDW